MSLTRYGVRDRTGVAKATWLAKSAEKATTKPTMLTTRFNLEILDHVIMDERGKPEEPEEPEEPVQLGPDPEKENLPRGERRARRTALYARGVCLQKDADADADAAAGNAARYLAHP